MDQLRPQTTLIDLNVEVDAVTTLDMACIHWLIMEHKDVRSLKDSIGVITANWDTTDENGSQGQHLDKDTEVQTLCLLIFWTKAQAFTDIASDLVIRYVHGGLGSNSKAYTLRLINKEEAKHKVRVASMMWNPILPPWCCKGGGGIVVAVGGGDGGGRWWCVVVLVMVVEPPAPLSREADSIPHR